MVLYRGSGADFKLILNLTGDCFAVRIRAPERVDPTRLAGPVDCYAYGYWTAGASAW
jgi:hypothetical protein